MLTDTEVLWALVFILAGMLGQAWIVNRQIDRALSDKKKEINKHEDFKSKSS